MFQHKQIVLIRGEGHFTRDVVVQMIIIVIRYYLESLKWIIFILIYSVFSRNVYTYRLKEQQEALVLLVKMKWSVSRHRKRFIIKQVENSNWIIAFDVLSSKKFKYRQRNKPMSKLVLYGGLCTTVQRFIIMILSFPFIRLEINSLKFYF